MKLSGLKLDAQARSLSIEADINFDQFEKFAEPLSRAIDSRVIEQHDGADRHQWLLFFEGTYIQLNYEFYGDICWLSVERDDEFEVLEYLESLLRSWL